MQKTTAMTTLKKTKTITMAKTMGAMRRMIANMMVITMVMRSTTRAVVSFVTRRMQTSMESRLPLNSLQVRYTLRRCMLRRDELEYSRYFLS